MSTDDDNLKNPEFTGGKILNGPNGEGVPSRDDVHRRARELAAIDGLRPRDVDERYLEQAREELTGEEIAPDDVLLEADELNSRDEVLGEAGRHVPNLSSSEDRTAAETLYSQGVDEALSDEMREGGKKLDRENRGLEAGDRDDFD